MPQDDGLDPVLEYVDSIAEWGRRATVQWLAGNGYDLIMSQGGESDSFGNAVLVFAQGNEWFIRSD